MAIITGGSGDDNLNGTNNGDTISGGAGDDFLQGKGGNDNIDGGQGNDQIQGNEGDDYITGGQGDDFIHGGIGTDTAAYSGSVLDYSFSRDGENLYVSHTGGTHLDGNDRLLHIERLKFSDIVIDLTQNNAPLAIDDTASTNEDNSVSGNVLSNDFDWEHDTLSATPGTFNGVYGSLVLNANGSYTYTPYASTQSLAQGQVVQDTFTYTVSDGSLSDTGTLTVTVSGNNDAPVANPDTATTGENSIVTVNVLANDSDVDNGAVLTVTAASAPAGQGSASVVGNQVQFNPGTDFDYLDTGETANVVVSYTIKDEHGATSSSTVTITVNGANDPPVANDDTSSTTEDASASGNVLANDTDVDVEPLTVTNPGTYVGSYGTLTLAADGSYTYAPNAAAQGLDVGETAQDVFGYTASDGTASDTATLTVTVNGVNDAPVANDDSASTNEDAAGVSGNVLANDTDVDVEPLTVANPGTYVGTYGTLVLAADGSYTYTPGAAAQGLDTGETAQDVFTYAASDGTASDTATLTVTVSGLNDAPVANDDTATTDENSPVSGNVLANDTDVDGETLTVVNAATFIGAYGTLVLAANGSYTYTPGAAAQALNNGQTANDVFTYIASDGTASDTATLTITVTGLSGAPNAVDDTATTTEDASVSGNVLTNDTDAENDPLTVTNPGTYAGTYGTLTLNANGSYTFTPNAAADGLATGESAQDVFSYTASDGGASDTANLTVTVNGTNDAPTIDAGGTDDSGSVTELPDGDPGEGTTVHTDSGAIAFDDPDLSDTHSASFTPQGGPYLGTFSLDPVNQPGDSVTWNFSVSDAALEGLSEGEIRFQSYQVQIDDGHGGTATQTVTITITGAGVGAGPQNVWYIDNTAVGSTNVGTQANPYTSIAAFNAAQGTVGGPQTGHTVHLLAGTGTGIYAEADGINLLNGQILVGDATGAVRPTIVTTAGDGINVAQNNNVSGIDLGNTSGAGIADSGGSVGTLVVNDVGKNGTGQIADFDQGGTLNVTLNDATSLGSSGGAIDLAGVGGSFTITGATTITGIHSGGGIDITGSSVTASFSGGGTVSTADTIAINFTGNSGTLALDGGFVILTTTGTGFNAAGGGTVTVEGTGNSVTAVSATAINFSGVTIGVEGATFHDVSSGNATAAADPSVGISLVNTGSVGFFHVTGETSTAQGGDGSGGTIQNIGGASGTTADDGAGNGLGTGVYLKNAFNVTLDRMQINDTSNFAVATENTTDFVMRWTTISGSNGDSDAQDEGSVRLLDPHGTNLLDSNDISGALNDNIRVDSNSGTLTALIISNNNIHDNNVTLGNHGILIDVENSPTVAYYVTDNQFSHNRADSVHVGASGGVGSASALIDVTISNNDFNGERATDLGGGVAVQTANFNGHVRYDISGNTFQPTAGNVAVKGGAAILVDAGSASSLGVTSTLVEGQIADNVIGDGTAFSGTAAGISAIRVELHNQGTHTTLIDGNDIQNYGNAGIGLTVGGTGLVGGTFNATITDNVIHNSNAAGVGATPNGINGNFGTNTGNAEIINLDISGNTLAGSGTNAGAGTEDFRLRQRFATDVFIKGYAGSLDDIAAVVAFVQGQNIGPETGSATNQSTVDTHGWHGLASVPQPTLPPPSPPPPSPLMAAHAPPAGPHGGDGLTQAGLDAIVGAAIDRWAAAGATDDQIAAMRAVLFDVGDLSGLFLGASNPGHVTIDSDAAGYGWFIDSTPGDDSEFDGSGARLTAEAGGAADGKIDALSVVMHELGHQLGLHDQHHGDGAETVMDGVLDAGERRLPEGVFATQHEMAVEHVAASDDIIFHLDIPGV